MQYTAIDLRKGESIFIYGLSLSKKNSENNYQGESEGMEYRKQWGKLNFFEYILFHSFGFGKM